MHGSLFAIKKSNVSLVGDAGQVLKEIHLGPSKLSGEEEKRSAKKEQGENYQVMGVEEEGTGLVNGMMNSSGRIGNVQLMTLMPENELDHLESKMTSVSSKKHAVKPSQSGGSLAVILS